MTDPWAQPHDVQLPAGRRLAGRFELRRRLGADSTGAVFAAYDHDQAKEVAVRIFLPGVIQSEQSWRYIVEAAHRTSRLNHPGIISTFGAHLDGHLHLLSMELIEGVTLRQKMDALRKSGQRFPIHEVIRLALELCDALSHAHPSMTHGGLKPDNILLDREGHARITDFEIACLLLADRGTVRQASIRSLPYLAPEQLRRDGAIDHRIDQYATAAITYEMLTGEVPVGRMKTARHLRRETPRGVSRALDRALEPLPSHRYPDMAAFGAALTTRGSLPLRRVALWTTMLMILSVVAAGVTLPHWHDKSGLFVSRAARNAKPTARVQEAQPRQEVWTSPRRHSEGSQNQGQSLIRRRRTGETDAVLPDADPQRNVPAGSATTTSEDTNTDPEFSSFSAGEPGAVIATKSRESKDMTHLLASARAFDGEGMPSAALSALDEALALDPHNDSARELRHKVLSRRFTNSIAMEFVLLPPGSFTMGSPVDEPGRDDDEDQQLVEIPAAFFLSTTEVTQAQWQRVMNDNPSRWVDDRRPVECVSWHDAMAFCERLNTIAQVHGPPTIPMDPEQRRKLRTTAHEIPLQIRRYRLPTEAEWEYACRAGTTTPFSFGSTITTDQANYDGTYAYADGPVGIFRGETLPVASFSPNARGLYDMHGNVWEWCCDRYEMPDRVLAPGRLTTTVTEGRVLRGGSWRHRPEFCRSANRVRGEPDDRLDVVGFRVVLETE